MGGCIQGCLTIFSQEKRGLYTGLSDYIHTGEEGAVYRAVRLYSHRRRGVCIQGCLTIFSQEKRGLYTGLSDYILTGEEGSVYRAV